MYRKPLDLLQQHRNLGGLREHRVMSRRPCVNHLNPKSHGVLRLFGNEI